MSDPSRTYKPGIKFYTREEYFRLLIDRIPKTTNTDAVTLATMTFDPNDPLVARILEVLNSAAKRGVDVRLFVDSYSFLRGKSVVLGPLFFHKNLDKKMLQAFQQKLDALNMLKTSGGKYFITNKPNHRFSVPVMGRSHIKLAVINEEVFLGGCNLTAYDHTDLMIGMKNKKIANRLRSIFTDIEEHVCVKKALNTKDISIEISKQSRIILDAGQKRRSMILEEAYKLIDEAKENIIFTCQYFPNSQTVKRLKKALLRGVEVKIIYNHPSNHPFPSNLLHYSVKVVQKIRMPKSFFDNELDKDQKFLHSKVLVTDKGCIVGSHNMVNSGVNFGTAEIAFLTNNLSFGELAIKKITEQIKPKTNYNK